MSMSIPAESIAIDSLGERVKQVLKAKITTGELVPGVLYSTAQVSAVLGVSNTPVREAILELAQLGLIDVHRNRGFTIPQVTDEDLNDLYELRLLVEVPATTAAAGCIGAVEAETCRIEAERSRVAARDGNLVAFLDADRAFHSRLIECLGNRRLVEQVARFRDEVRLPGLANLAQGALIGSADEHLSLLDAVRSGDSAATNQSIRRHLQHTRGLWAGRAEVEPAQRTRSGFAAYVDAHVRVLPPSSTEVQNIHRPEVTK